MSCGRPPHPPLSMPLPVPVRANAGAVAATPTPHEHSGSTVGGEIPVPPATALPPAMLTALWRSFGPKTWGDTIAMSITSLAPAQKVLGEDPKLVGILISVGTGSDVYFGWVPQISNDVNPASPYGHRLGAGGTFYIGDIKRNQGSFFLRSATAVASFCHVTPQYLDRENIE